MYKKGDKVIISISSRDRNRVDEGALTYNGKTARITACGKLTQACLLDIDDGLYLWDFCYLLPTAFCEVEE